MNILIIKTGALGDVVRTSFIAQALKIKYKQFKPKIFWITSEKAKTFFLNNPYIHKVLLEKDINIFKKFFFDLIINLEEDYQICKSLNFLKRTKLIGAFLNKENEVDYTEDSKQWFDLSLISKLGKIKADFLKKTNKKTHREILSEILKIANYQKYEPFLRLTPNQREISKNFRRRHNLSRYDLIIGINAGSAERWPKQLSVIKTIQLINKLSKKFNAKIILFGGPEEIERNKQIMIQSKAYVIDTGCGNNLFEFPALINVCNLFITTDTLGLHISLALKRPTVVLIGPTSPSEIDLFGIGEKVIANSNCVSCYRKNCNSMDKIKVEEIVFKTKKLLNKKITLLITSFNEPNLSRSIEAALNQNTKHDYEVIISTPEDQTINFIKKNYKKVKVIKDPGKGKSFALNFAFSKINTDILILTDGDVYLSNNAIESITNMFLDPEIGVVSGRPFPVEKKDNKYGYWANFLLNAAHRIRKKSFDSNSFIEASGYLFAFRKDKLQKIPIDVAEDTIIPYIFWEKGYKIGYAENAKSYVKSPDNWDDWVKQKLRTHKSHGKLALYADIKTTPKIKSFKTEIGGIRWLLGLPKNLKEFFWVFELIFARLYTWWKYFVDTHIKEEFYQDAWERVESTK